MFRLAKVLNSNLQYEVVTLKNTENIPVEAGCAIICDGGAIAPATCTSMPEYITFVNPDEDNYTTVTAMLVTENMIFKTEYTGDTKPYVGMTVGLSKAAYEMDSVCPDKNGKGTVLSVDEKHNLVYVRFRR